MVDVTAKLVNGPLFFTGDIVECNITFSNPTNQTLEVARSNSDLFDSLAFASAQIYCECSINEKLIVAEKVKEKNVKPVTVQSETTFAPMSSNSGHAVLNTKPKILFCDLKLSPGESKSFAFREMLPNDSPPSYRGQAVKYSYKITVGTQRINTPIKLLKLPFRVLSLKEIPEGAACGDSAETTPPNNPFLETHKESPLEFAMEALMNITARRSPNFYNITNARGKVVRFCLFKHSYKLGEDIVGTFDFSNSTVSCSQVCVTLQSEEHIAEDYKKGKSPPDICSHNKYHAVVIGYLYTHLTLQVPFHITPDFATELVTLKHRLHFEFVTTVKPIEFPNEDATCWEAPAELEVETMVWDLPVQIYPAMVPSICPVIEASLTV